MKCPVRRSLIFCSALLLLGASSLATAQPVFFDDFEDRVADQPTIGNNWTWYDQWFEGDTCGVNSAGGGGPCDNDGDCNNDFEQDNRNFTNAGADDSYYRAGLEVPASSGLEAPSWEGTLTNMLRVYGNQYIPVDTGFCQRVLIFQQIDQLTSEHVGSWLFSFDVVKDRFGAPANGEITAGFVKVIKRSDTSYDELLFESVETMLPDNELTERRYIEFEITDKHVGELLQFGFYNDVVEDLGQSWATAAAMYDNVTLDAGGIGPGHSGSWNFEPQRGHGFSMEFGNSNGTPYAVIYWYVYNDAGDPIFMVGQGVPEGNRVEVTFYSPYGMIYGDFDPATVPSPLDVGGTGVFEFSSSTQGTFSYTPSEFSETKWGHTTPVENLEISKFFGVPAEPIFPVVE
jgi:hypothetical protein